ncbi:MAG TPA: zf-HC2 domain-containing protein [Blastocatellia bacterium]|nr:zf-HC2 domain-containing protein [Blastocatellia bacterium]
MTSRSEHPDKELFEYLNGALDTPTATAVEAHVENCSDCSALAAIVRGLKSGARKGDQSASSAPGRQPAHPDVGELASLFYGGPARARSSAVRAHVAVCTSCADELAQYARAERLAEAYQPSQAAVVGIPDNAWEMINEWEDSAFARPRDVGETASRRRLVKLSDLLMRGRDRLRNRAQETLAGSETEPASRAGLVPVIIVDRSGEFRGVEMFEREAGALRHAEGSERFNNKPFHAVLDFGEKKCVAVSDLIQRDTMRLQDFGRGSEELRRADYFIVED